MSNVDRKNPADAWAEKYEAERAARVRAEEALREIRWLHHDDAKTYQQLFFEAARIAERIVGGNTP